MTRNEFEHRRSKLSYSCADERGDDDLFPPDVKGIRRKTLGRTGKGRHISAGLDELERRVQLEALATAFAVAAVALIALNQFQVADVLGPEVWVFPWLAIWCGYTYGLVAAKRRYQ